ncbi:pyridoxine 5'-phosphate synthase [Candidatus Sumerlaeota bacterium]|nr:pyridoxine 5'-phosphate synthase [Candidatus Sumerlaeota bacterium]
MAKLCVNVDHVATLREARKTDEPDPLEAARVCVACGVAGITIHLREDRRHIQDHDLTRMRAELRTMLNLEMAATDEMVGIALKERPDQATLVPEKREEITTEGGLDVVGNQDAIARAVASLQKVGIPVSLFIDPDPAQIEASARTGAQLVELHTGSYCNTPAGPERERELDLLVREAAHAQELGLRVNAGHGLTCENVAPVAAIRGMNELNIGHSVVARAVLVGIEQAVREMMRRIDQATA